MPRKVDRISGVRLVTDETSLDWALEIREERRKAGLCPSCGCANVKDVNVTRDLAVAAINKI